MKDESPPLNIDEHDLTPDTFLDTVGAEVSLFRAVTRARPVGLHRHFHMMCIILSVEKDTSVRVSAEDVWAKLGGMYDLEALEDLVRCSFLFLYVCCEGG